MAIESAVIYDIEIIKAIPDGNQREGIKYAKGWTDYGNMGISVICAFDLQERMPRVFLRDNFEEFEMLCCNREYTIGYNSKSFDDNVLKAYGYRVSTDYDIYDEVKIAAGRKPRARIAGYKLEDMVKYNFGESKSMNGADAPLFWQQGRRGEVIDYCMKDVILTAMLWRNRDYLHCPVTGEKMKPLRSLFEGKHNGTQPRLIDLELEVIEKTEAKRNEILHYGIS